MTVNDVHSGLIDESPGKSNILAGYRVSPVPSPVDGGDDDIPPLFCFSDFFADTPHGPARHVGQQVDALLAFGSSPSSGNSAGIRTEGEYKYPALARDIQDGRRLGFLQVPPGPGG